MEYYSTIKKKEIESVIVRWMNPKPVKERAVSQKEKSKHCILRHIYVESTKRVLMNLFTEKDGDTGTENGLVNTAEEGESRIN